MPPTERLLSVLFADICGSTALYESVGDTEAHRRVAGCLDALQSTAVEFRGRVVKFIGDELMCAFDDADAAVGAASQMQARLEALRAANGATPRIRIGVAHGPVLEDGDDLFGDTVNVAARITGLASPGQVLTNKATLDVLAPAIRASCRLLRPVELKGVQGSVPIVDVLWNAEATLTMIVDSRSEPAPDAGNALVLRHGDSDLRLDASRRVARIGRDPGNDLVVATRTASRWHARVLLQHGNFVLVDQSVNGTYVRFDGKPEVHLQREETLLVGRGLIGLGESTAAGDAATISFTAQ